MGRVRTNATGKAPWRAAAFRERLQRPGKEARGRLIRPPRVSRYAAGRRGLGPTSEDCFRQAASATAREKTVELGLLGAEGIGVANWA